VTITKGIKELDDAPIEKRRIRSPGSGRPSLVKRDPILLDLLKNNLEETTRGATETLLL
jgi:hypothetical protein